MFRYISLFISVLVSSSLFGQELTKKSAEEDLKFLYEALTYGHPVNLAHEKKDDLKIVLDRALLDLPQEISKTNFENSVRKMLFENGCIHTAVKGWSSKKDAKKEQLLFPFEIFIEDKKLLMVENLSENQNMPIEKGDEILEINGKSSKEIIETLVNYHPVDGKSYAFSYSLINNFFPSLFFKSIDTTSCFTISYKTKNDEVLQYKTKGYKPKQIVKSTRDKKIIFQGNGACFYVKDHSIGVLEIKSFEKKHKQFYKQVFHYIAVNSIKNLVIDVRNNFGGSRKNASELLSYLVAKECAFKTIRPEKTLKPFLTGKNKFTYLLSYLYYDIPNMLNRKKTKNGVEFTTKIHPKEIVFDGKLFVLINGFTSSSASLLASYTKHYSNSIVIGQQTGGGEFYNNGGSYPTLVLPNSKLQITTATYHMRYDFSGTNKDGLKPDYEIKYTIESYKKRDLEYEKVVELIKN